MSLLKNVHEMTMMANDLSYNLSRFFEKAKREIDSFEHVGDIANEFKVMNRGNEFLLTTSDNPITFFVVKGLDSKVPELNVAYVTDDMRKQNVFAKFVWFLKRFKQFDVIQLGDVHSKDTIAALKKLSNRFDVYWNKGDERVKYNPETVDDFYSNQKPSGWVITLENDGDFSLWPKFFNENECDIKQQYDWLLD